MTNLTKATVFPKNIYLSIPFIITNESAFILNDTLELKIVQF